MINNFECLQQSQMPRNQFQEILFLNEEPIKRKIIFLTNVFSRTRTLHDNTVIYYKKSFNLKFFKCLKLYNHYES